MKTSIRFYKPTENFKKIKEHMCVCRELEDGSSEILSINGNNEILETKSYIESAAQSVIMALSFKLYSAIHKNNIQQSIYEIDLIKKDLIETFLNTSAEFDDKTKNLVRELIDNKINEYL